MKFLFGVFFSVGGKQSLLIVRFFSLSRVSGILYSLIRECVCVLRVLREFFRFVLAPTPTPTLISAQREREIKIIIPPFCFIAREKRFFSLRNRISVLLPLIIIILFLPSGAATSRRDQSCIYSRLFGKKRK